jgi:uncharacterized membrane protein YdjX (TVP38/TMEM64 family)
VFSLPRPALDPRPGRDPATPPDGRRPAGGRAPTRRVVFPAVAVAAAAVLAWLLVPDLRDGAGRIAAAAGHLEPAALRDGLRAMGAWAPLGYFLLQVAQVLFPVLPATPITFAGVLLLGWQAGLVLGLGGQLLAGAAQFAAVRRWGRPLVARLVGQATFDRYAGRLDPRGWWLPAAFLVPFAPADALGALAGLTTMSLRRFLVLSLVGRLPWGVAAVLLAAGVEAGPAAAWAVAGLVAAVALALVLVRRRAAARASGAAGPAPPDGVPDGTPGTIRRCPSKAPFGRATGEDGVGFVPLGDAGHLILTILLPVGAHRFDLRPLEAVGPLGGGARPDQGRPGDGVQLGAHGGGVGWDALEQGGRPGDLVLLVQVDVVLGAPQRVRIVAVEGLVQRLVEHLPAEVPEEGAEFLGQASTSQATTDPRQPSDRVATRA